MSSFTRGVLELLEEFGWCKDVTVDSQGRHCVYGAALYLGEHPGANRAWGHGGVDRETQFSTLAAKMVPVIREWGLGGELVPAEQYEAESQLILWNNDPQTSWPDMRNALNLVLLKEEHG